MTEAGPVTVRWRDAAAVAVDASITAVKLTATVTEQ
jgi:hypothetical protein